jgi:actin-related protein
MFENFNVQGLYIELESLLSLFSAGKDTGISVDLGDGISHFVPIYFGCSLPHAIKRINLAGRDLTEYLEKLLEKKGYSFSTMAEKEIIKDIKEKACYISNNNDGNEINNIKNFLYELPDGNSIELKEERIKCPEVLFNPKIIDKEENNIIQNCFEAIEKCDNDIKKDMYKCIVLSGGCSMIDGLEERFYKEIKNIVNDDLKNEVKLVTGSDKKYGVWTGGALLSMSGFELKWITKPEYEEFGDLIVHKKCV